MSQHNVRERKWDYEAGVVVLGAGMAGTVAAIEAYDLGEDVLLLEKAPEADVGGGGRVSGQTLTCVSDKAKLMEYQRNLNKPNVIPEDILETWAEAMTTQRPWISARAEEVGMVYNVNEAKLIEHDEFPGSDGIEGIGHIRYSHEWSPEMTPYEVLSLHGPAHTWEAMYLNVKKRGIKVLYETPAVELIQDPETREILGVVAEREGKKVNVKARKAVILCTGGYEQNAEMLADYYGVNEVSNLGSPYDTGDGIKMLLKVGADLWHMRNPTTTGGLWICIKVPGYQPFFRNLAIPVGSWVELAKDGTRFYNEGYQYALKHMHMDFHGGKIDAPHYQCLPVHLIFDEAARKAAPIVTLWMGWGAVVQKYEWSADNSVEIEKGWITKADTIRELATKLGKDPDVVEAEVKKYNEYCKMGRDPDYGRDPNTMQPLETPPYYGINLWPSVVSTTGGGRHNKEAEVLDPDGKPIPRLYEAGELGSILANLYQNGSFLTEAVIFGRIAAKNAAKQKPWS